MFHSMRLFSRHLPLCNRQLSALFVSRFHLPALAISILYHGTRDCSVWDYRVSVITELEVITENNLVQSLHFTVRAPGVAMIDPSKCNYFKPRGDSLESVFLGKTTYPGSHLGQLSTPCLMIRDHGIILLKFSLGSFLPLWFIIYLPALSFFSF